MRSKNVDVDVSPLTTLLPDAPFTEFHAWVVDAPPDPVWEALHHLRWRDLRVAVPLMLLRGLGQPIASDTVFQTFTSRAGAVLVEDPPASAMLVMVGRPWSAIPRHAHATTLADVAQFDQPNWLRYGMDFVLHPLPGGRTLLETRTRCQPTDAVAHRRFRVYWRVINTGSSVIRLDMLAAVRRAVAQR